MLGTRDWHKKQLMNRRCRCGFGGLKFKQFGEGAFQEEDHENKIRTRLSKGFCWWWAPHQLCREVLLPHSWLCESSASKFIYLMASSTICRRALCLPEPGELPSGYLSPAVGQPSLSPPTWHFAACQLIACHSLRTPNTTACFVLPSTVITSRLSPHLFLGSFSPRTLCTLSSQDFSPAVLYAYYSLPFVLLCFLVWSLRAWLLGKRA